MTPLDTTLLCVRFVHYTAELFLFGGLSFPLYCRLADQALLQIQARRLEWAAAATAVSALAWFACTVAGMNDSAAALLDADAVWAVLVDSNFGYVWAVHFLLIMALTAVLVGLPAHPFRRDAALLTVPLAAALLLTQAMTGHAIAGGGSQAVRQVGAHTLHLWAAGVWLGGLPPLLQTLEQARRHGRATATVAVAAVVRRFSAVALPAVVLLALSGLVNLAEFGGLGTVWQAAGSYMWVLKLKLLVFVLLLALAALNRFGHMARLHGSGAMAAVHALSGSTRAEIALGLAVLALISGLGMLAPPLG